MENGKIAEPGFFKMQALLKLYNLGLEDFSTHWLETFLFRLGKFEVDLLTGAARDVPAGGVGNRRELTITVSTREHNQI